jgi:hypothetical protein
MISIPADCKESLILLIDWRRDKEYIHERATTLTIGNGREVTPRSARTVAAVRISKSDFP